MALLLLAAALSLLFLKALAIKLIIPLAALIWAVLRALWVRLDPPQGFAIDHRTALLLFDRVEQLRRVLVPDDLNAAVVQVPRLGLFGWHRHYLLLGLHLLKCLTAGQLDKVSTAQTARSRRNWTRSTARAFSDPRPGTREKLSHATRQPSIQGKNPCFAIL